MRAKKTTTTGTGTIKLSDDHENGRLRGLLQKAVNREKAPESLRDKIRKMIRE
jgi:hypothetical protein